MPHPSENVINVRIQMYGEYLYVSPALSILISSFPDNHSSLDALIEALEELDKVCETVEEAYTTSLKEGKFERWEEKY